MARISSHSPSVSPAVTEAGRRFQLQPSTEKRTQGSTMFSTTAKNLTSSVPFRWRADQVKIFEDWILFKGPNAMSADLLPLLRALDLDGYEDVKNHSGECVHDLIIVKVRRKLTRTKSNTDMEMEEKRALDTSKATPMRRGDAASVTSPRATVLEQIRESGCGDKTAAIIKREQEDEYESFIQSPEDAPWHETPGGYRHEFSAASDTGPILLRASRRSNDLNTLPSSTSGKGDATTIPSPPAAFTDADLADVWSLGQGQPMQRTASRSRVVASRSRINKDLVAGIAELKAAMKEFYLVVNRLPGDNEAALLETATHDTQVEIDYLEDMVRDYLRN
ncbi:hypothetical protein F4801DRAFT_537909 [Xylaria longipes]|nr:hypothetical protein F4801DRAFT_537909 [Xylaria longipes]RYC58909.1 hypothetical protein CHU98_g7307 [Xylaria longipes]